jgi:Spy/CpxP family protein refolding chaperone
MKIKLWIITVAVLFGIFLIYPVWAADPSQPSSTMKMPCPEGKGPAITGGGGMMMGKSMMHGRAGTMRSKGMMHGRKTGRYGYRMRRGTGSDLTRSFHKWMKGFMAHKSLFDLSSDQMNKLEDLLAEHLKSAIRKKAEIRVLRVDLIQTLRKEPMDVKAAEDLLKKIYGEKTELQVEGIQLYSQVMQFLNDQQKAKVKEILGSPFCTPWESMRVTGDGSSGEQTDEPEVPSDDEPMEEESGTGT